MLGIALLGVAGSAPEKPPLPTETVRPASGRLLVASQHIRGPFFERSVVLLLSYAQSGAIGLIVNRPTDIALHDVVQGAVDGAGDLYLGGPVERGAVMVLVRAESPPERAIRVVGDVFMTVDPAILLERTRKLGGAGDVRVYAGYAGWGPGQLDSEIARGDWIVVSDSVESIFDESPGELWQKLHLRHHRLLALAR
jgi:putative transcriptional regulator